MNKMINDPRIEMIRAWLPQVLGHEDFTLVPASADASFRRYFRACYGDQQRIIMDAPPEREDCHPFIAVSAMLASMGLHVPEVLVQDLDKGLLLLTDLGSQTYLQALEEQADSSESGMATSLYADAITALVQMQSYPVEQDRLPVYDRKLLMTEMGLFRDWYLGEHLKRTLTESEQALLENTFTLLADSALAQPQVLVHRDYHSRNLMVDPSSPPRNPGILDFQDAVIGAVTYDLVSLLRDCYIAWPQEQVQQWADDYFQQAKAAGVINNEVNSDQFMRWFDWMGIQRHLKASGIFARLNHRDNKPGYLDDIPRTLNYIVEVSARYPELAEFHAFIKRLL
ncbi:MAG: phosphotransferase [Gammaproteobacteria bacterium]|nr:phosphotransferase [Gammaproteobacteria bacterium]